MKHVGITLSIARRYANAVVNENFPLTNSKSAAEAFAKVLLVEERKKVAEAALVQLEDKPKHAGGRPAKVGRPWEGICSKTEWYRRRKAKEEKA